MRYLLASLLLLAGCGMFGNKDEPETQSDGAVSQRDRDRAECEMRALEAIPPGAEAEARIERYTRLCMQSRGYPADATEVKVRIRE